MCSEAGVMVKICCIEGCNNKSRNRGMCIKHYTRFRRTGSPYKTISEREYHGMRNTRVYRLWANIINRCENKNTPDYPRYGGRGIYICKKWRNSFTAFYNDVGDPPFEDAQLDRIDNDDGYKPENVRWVDNLENGNNRHYEAGGVTYQKSSNRYIAQCRYYGESYYLGCFKTYAEAARAYRNFRGLD